MDEEREFDDYFGESGFDPDFVKRVYRQGRQYCRWQERDGIIDRIEELVESVEKSSVPEYDEEWTKGATGALLGLRNELMGRENGLLSEEEDNQ